VEKRCASDGVMLGCRVGMLACVPGRYRFLSFLYLRISPWSYHKLPCEIFYPKIVLRARRVDPSKRHTGMSDQTQTSSESPKYSHLPSQLLFQADPARVTQNLSLLELCPLFFENSCTAGPHFSTIWMKNKFRPLYREVCELDEGQPAHHCSLAVGAKMDTRKAI
jgi:hypothetical protein